jgi:hypothetical protein
MISSKLTTLITSTAVAAGLLANAQAGTSAGKGIVVPPTSPAKEESPFDKVWSLFSLYKNDSNPALEELSLIGRYQGQYYSTDGDKSNDSDWENRRFRLGLKAKMLDKHLEFKGEMYSNLLSEEDFYAGLKNFNLTYKFNEAFQVMVGKFEPNFGYYYSKSDTLLVPFERSALANQFKNEYSAGVSVFGKSDKWTYGVSVNDNAPDKEFGNLDGGWSLVAGAGYDLKDELHMDKAVFHVDYLHSEHKVGDTVLTGFDNGVAAYLELKQGDLGLAAEVLGGFGTADVWGISLEPTYDITKQLQLVGRYQLAISSDDKGVAPQKRYESKVGAGKGDTYNAAYIGLNYFVYGQKLKLMTGLEYANMNGGDSTLTWLGGVRIFW